MTRFQLFLCRHYLPKILAQECENPIPRSGEEGKNVDCFSVKIDDRGAPFFWVRSMVGDDLVGFEWDGSRFSVQKSLDLKTLQPQNLFIAHYYGLAEVRYSGISDLAIGRITRWPYTRINIVHTLNRFDQYLFNKKKLITKQRIDLLKFLLQKHLDGKTPISSLDLMVDLYSIKWVLHPDGDAQHKKVNFYLDSLVRSGELDKIDYKYSVAGAALRTIEEYEEEERKHTETVKMQRRMFWLTLVIAFLTFVQAGLIKIPTLVDFSNPHTQVENKILPPSNAPPKQPPALSK